jgi:hypothetical protein
MGKVRKHLAASGTPLKRFNGFGRQAGFNGEVKALYLGGLRIREVAERLGCCAVKVQRRLKWLGVKVRNASQYYSPEVVRRHKRMVYWKSRGLSVNAIAEMEGAPVSTVYYVLLRNGVRMCRSSRMSRNKRAIVKMAVLNREKYRAYADRKVAEKEAKRGKWAAIAVLRFPLPDL